MTAGLAPGFLIAMPQLVDVHFVRAVLLLLHHDADGAMGVVINRRLDLPLLEVARQQGVEGCQAAGSAYYGGPVEMHRGLVLHRGPGTAEDSEILDGTYISGSVDTLRLVLQEADREFRLFLGYAGWGPGQLDDELATGAWLTGEFDPAFVFGAEPDGVWDAVLAQMGIDPATILQGGEIA